MPATATLTVQRHHLSLALLPGVTGRRDVFAARRDEVLAALRPALEVVRVPGGTVTVVAPALVARTATGAAPDPGASGFVAGPVTPIQPPAPALPALDGTAEEPALHVTGSAAVALLRLAGWTQQITTYEVGADAGVCAQTVVSPGRVGPHLVIFAVAQPDGVLPAGASAVLARAEQRTHALYREVVALR